MAHDGCLHHVIALSVTAWSCLCVLGLFYSLLIGYNVAVVLGKLYYMCPGILLALQ